MVKDRGRLAELLDRAQARGPTPLLFTVDLPAPGPRHRDARTGMAGEPSMRRSLQRLLDGARHPAWVWDVYLNGQPHGFGNLQGATEVRRGESLRSWIPKNFDPAASWRDMDWVRARWKGPIAVKGVLDPEDAELAMQSGAEAVIVSNHGGRQLDGVSSSIAALPRIVDQVGGRTAVLMDGGVRSGPDVLRALALGADACLIGRAWAWALAAEGERGVARLLAVLRHELRTAMILTGCRDVAEAGRELIARA
jgi:L-lactate dehydrogenase (cytochrome)